MNVSANVAGRYCRSRCYCAICACLTTTAVPINPRGINEFAGQASGRGSCVARVVPRILCSEAHGAPPLQSSYSREGRAPGSVVLWLGCCPSGDGKVKRRSSYQLTGTWLSIPPLWCLSTQSGAGIGFQFHPTHFVVFNPFPRFYPHVNNDGNGDGTGCVGVLEGGQFHWSASAIADGNSPIDW